MAFVAWCALQLGDILTTVVGLAQGIPEASPLPRMVLTSYGLAAMLGLKVVAALGTSVVVLAFTPRLPGLWSKFYSVGNSILLATVLWNLTQLSY